MSTTYLLARTARTALATLVISASVAAATREVPQDYDTIQEAVTAAQSGDVILIDKGEFAEAVTVEKKSNLTIRGMGKKTRLKKGAGSSTSIDVIDSSDITIESIRFSDAQRSIETSFGTRIRIRKCVMDGLIGVDAAGTTEIEVFDCTFNTVSEGVLVIGSGKGSAIVGCRFLDPGTGFLTGVRVFSSSASQITVADNKFVGCSTGALLDSGVAILDCEFVACVTGARFGAGSEVTVAGNSFKKCGTAILCPTVASSGVIDDNAVKGGNAGIDLDQVSGFLVTRNQVKKTQGDAIRVRANATESLFSKNKAVKAGASGFHVEGVGNSLHGNAAKKSAGFDLNDETSDGDNAYSLNKFPTIAPS